MPPETQMNSDTVFIDRRTSVAEASPEPDQKQYEPFQPLFDRVVVRRIKEAPKDHSFAIPEKYRQQTNKGEVVYVGTGMYLGGAWHPIPLKPGDIVLFGEYGAEKFFMDGEELESIFVGDIRAVKRLKA
jgi:chaperonin GroES